MAQLEKLVPLILKWEGGFVNDPADLGGPTNKGVTLATWKQQGYDKNGDGKIDIEDLKLITTEDMVERILRPHYWNRWQADRIESQALANIVVDWVWGSGRQGITIPQDVLGVLQDGIVGEKTLRALNNYPAPEELFEKIKQKRREYLHSICMKRPANKRFLKGWLNRLNDFKWIPLALAFGVMFSCRSVQKMETLNETQTVEMRRTASLQSEQKNYERQIENLLQEQNELRTTEIMTAVFDTVDSLPVLRQIQIKRIVSDRTNHAEQQTERRTTGTEILNGTQTVETRQDASLQSASKEKLVRNTRIVWIAVGAIVVLGFILLRKSVN